MEVIAGARSKNVSGRRRRRTSIERKVSSPSTSLPQTKLSGACRDTARSSRIALRAVDRSVRGGLQSLYGYGDGDRRGPPALRPSSTPASGWREVSTPGRGRASWYITFAVNQSAMIVCGCGRFSMRTSRRAQSMVTEVWRVANWFEREAFDLFGILFRGSSRPAHEYLPTTGSSVTRFARISVVRPRRNALRRRQGAGGLSAGEHRSRGHWCRVSYERRVLR